jgi:hypothetical protein
VLIGGLIGGVLGVGAKAFNDALNALGGGLPDPSEPNLGASIVLSVGLIGGLIGGLISGLLGGLTDKVNGGKAFPNEGIKLSGKSATIAAVIGFLSVGVGVALSVGLSEWLSQGLMVSANERLSFALSVGLGFAVSVAAILGLNRGGSAVVKHYSIRLILWLCGYTPFRFIRLLDDCARLIILKKVGGGYIFIHRMLLEYFAGLNSEAKT